MRKCVLNDCTGFKSVAPCCFECEEKDRCPDRCWKVDRESRDTTFCTSMIEVEDNDG